MAKYLDSTGLTTVWDAIKSNFAKKTEAVTNVSYDTTNKKITKTINGTTSDVVTAAKIVQDGGGITGITKNVTYNGTLTNNRVAVFSGTTGVIKASSYTISKSVPSDAVFTDTHRPINMNDTEVLGDNMTALTLTAGTNVTLSNPSTGVISISASDTHNKHSIAVTNGTATSGGSSITYVESGTGGTASDGNLALTLTRKTVTIPTVPANTVTGANLSADTIILGNGSSTIKTSNKTITTTLGSDDTTVPTSKAVETAISSALASGVKYRGDFNASTGAISGSTTMTSLKESIGDMFVVSTAGKFAGTDMEVGDSIIFKKNVAAGTAVGATDITYVEGTVSVAAGTSAVTWDTEATLATVEGVAIKIKIPANPDTHNSHALNVTNGTATAGGSSITYVESVSGCSATSGDLSASTVRKTVTIPTVPSKIVTYSGTPVNNQVLVFSGTTGIAKPSGYTIGKSVPSDAVFTDTKVTSASNHYGYTANSGMDSGLYKIATDDAGHVTSASAVQKSDITALGIPESDTNTWRKVQVNGSDILGSATTTNPLNLSAGTNVTLSNSNGTVTISATDTNTHRPIKMNATQVLGDNTTALTLSAGTNVTLSNPSTGVIAISASISKVASATTSTSAVTSVSATTANSSVTATSATTSISAVSATTANSAVSATSATTANSASTADTATNLKNKPSLAVSGTTKITVTAGGKTSDAFTVPFATSATTANSASTATSANTVPESVISGYGFTKNPAANNGTYSVKVSGATVTTVSDFTADQSSNDDVNFIAGSNVTLTPNATNRSITIAASISKVDSATTSTSAVTSVSATTAVSASTANSANTATNLASKPSLATSNTTKITVTAGGKTSDAFTVPFATSATTANSALTSNSATTSTSATTANSANSANSATTAISAQTVPESVISGYGFTKNAGNVSGNSLTTDKIILGAGTTKIKSSGKGITTTAPSSTSTDDDLPTSKAVYSAINSALVSAMVYKGTISSAPPTTGNKTGDTYVVSTAFGTYEVGDLFIWNGASWDVINGENQVEDKNVTLAWSTQKTIATVDGTDIHVTLPANPNTDTHRPIKMNTTQVLGDNTTALTLSAGTNVTLSNPSTGVIAISASISKVDSATTSTSAVTSVSATTSNSATTATSATTASSANTATNLASKPSLAVSGTTKITVTAGGKTSDAFTVPFATSATTSASATTAASANSATTATNLSAKPSLATSNTTKITVTAGGKTSDAFTVPFATSATTSASATTANSATTSTSAQTVPESVISGYGFTKNAAANNGTYSIKVSGTSVTTVSDFTADQSSNDDVNFIAGSNITITPNATNRSITIAAAAGTDTKQQITNKTTSTNPIYLTGVETIPLLTPSNLTGATNANVYISSGSTLNAHSGSFVKANDGQGISATLNAEHSDGSISAVFMNNGAGYSYAGNGSIVAGSMYNETNDSEVTSIDTGNGAIAVGVVNNSYSNNTADYQSYISAADGSIAVGFANAGEGENIASIVTNNGSIAVGYADATESGEIESVEANGLGSIAVGRNVIANGNYSQAFGEKTIAEGNNSHAEGWGSEAYGTFSHAEGSYTVASGSSSHAEGDHSQALGAASHAEGISTIADRDYMTAVGKYNQTGNTKALFVVGNGTSNARSNAMLVDSDSNITISGGLKKNTGGSSTTVWTTNGGTATLPTDTNTWRPIKVNNNNFLTDRTTALNLSAGTNVTLTTGSTGLITISASGGVGVDSTDRNNKLFLVGATTQSSNPDTVGSYSSVYEQQGNLHATRLSIADASAGSAGAVAAGYSDTDEGLFGGVINASSDGSSVFGYSESGGEIQADECGSHARGFVSESSLYAYAYGSSVIGCARNIGRIRAYSNAEGSIAGGYVHGTSVGGGGYNIIETAGKGAIAFGAAYTINNGESTHSQIISSGNGTTAIGYAVAYENNILSEIKSIKNGSVAIGCASGGTIEASGDGSFAGGNTSGVYLNTKIQALGNGAFAFGNSEDTDDGYYSEIIASGSGSFAVGYANSSDIQSKIIAQGTGSFAGGYANDGEGSFAGARGSFAFGLGAATYGDYSHAEGESTIASGSSSHAEGYGTLASGSSSHAEGYNTKAYGTYSHAEGQSTTASGNSAHAEGYNTKANGTYSHAEGWSTQANGHYSHAEGYNTIASGYSHAEGSGAQANGNYSHAEGYDTRANGLYSHAEGYSATASGQYSHAEGFSTTASGQYSHAEGFSTTALGSKSHAGGSYAIASGDTSFAFGDHVTATTANSFVIGMYNSSLTSYDLFAIGNGRSSTYKYTPFVVSTDSGSTANQRPVIVTVRGKINASSGFFQTSDINKKNIEGELDLDKAYDLIDKCQTILYTLKDDDSKKQEIGLIAQEVQEFFPELISKDTEGNLSLDYSRLTVVILRVLKDLIKRISKLENKE